MDTATTPATRPRRRIRATDPTPRPPTLVELADRKATLDRHRAEAARIDDEITVLARAMVASEKYNMADIAKVLGQTRQAVSKRLREHR